MSTTWVDEPFAPELNERILTFKTTLRQTCGQELVVLLAMVLVYHVDRRLAVVVQYRGLTHQCPALNQATNLVIGIDMS